MLEWTLPADTTAARVARGLVADELGRRGVADAVRHDAELIASELAANAIRHGAPPVTLRLRVGAVGLRIEVRDEGRHSEPAVPEPSTTAGHGRGLAIVGQLADDHGWSRDEAGMTVWAELPLT